MPRSSNTRKAAPDKHPGGALHQAAREIDPDLLARALAIMRGASDAKAGMAEACRMVAESEPGVERLITEMLQGDASSFWQGIERGYGKAPITVEVEARNEVAIRLADATPNVLRVLALIALEADEQAKVGAIEGHVAEVPVQRLISSASDNGSYVNSDAPKPRARRPIF